MRKIKYRVELYFGGELPDEVKYTFCIDEARELVNGAEHGIIINEQGISVC
tara:strand:+ start:972 stop:1124 length:153 start_codon:yes stop_codon:yes gene_type:complete